MTAQPEVEILHTRTGVLVTDAEAKSEAWFAARSGGITGTDLPKILGLNRYGNALSVWLDKRGELEDQAGEEALWGQLLEDPVAQEWAARHGATVEPVGVLRHADQAWMRASLDRLVVHGTCPDGGRECGLEVKTRSAFKAADWRDGVPDEVLAQTTWGLIVTGLDHMHVAALIGGQRLTSYRVDRDAALEGYLIEAALPVWQAVTEGTPPEAHPDAEGVLLDLLDRLYSQRAGDRPVDPDEAGKWLAQYDDASELERKAKRAKVEAKTALVQMLDDGERGVIDEAPVFTYLAPDPSDTVTAAALRSLRDDQPETYEALKSEGYITTTNPGRRFAIKKRATTNGDSDEHTE